MLSASKKPLIKKTKVKLIRAGRATLKLALTAAARRTLKKHKLRFRVLITYTPTGGSPASKTVTVTVRRHR